MFSQIIEVKNEIYAVYEEENKTETFSRIYFAALDDKNGFMCLMTGADDGVFDAANDCTNFLRYHYGPKPATSPKGKDGRPLPLKVEYRD